MGGPEGGRLSSHEPPRRPDFGFGPLGFNIDRYLISQDDQKQHELILLEKEKLRDDRTFDRTLAIPLVSTLLRSSESRVCTVV